MKYKKLFSAGFSEKDPFNIFSQTFRVHSPSQLSDDGILILWGGEDISPSIYNQAVVHARAPATPSPRDIMEMELFKTAVDLGIPIIGVCRGAQLACALSGGTLYQHLEHGHHSDHKIMTYTGETLTTTSCHHQALNLDGVGHELLAWDKGRKTKVYTDNESFEVTIPEIVYLTDNKVFAIQGHPEWMLPTTPFNIWCANEIKRRFA